MPVHSKLTGEADVILKLHGRQPELTHQEPVETQRRHLPARAAGGELGETMDQDWPGQPPQGDGPNEDKAWEPGQQPPDTPPASWGQAPAGPDWGQAPAQPNWAQVPPPPPADWSRQPVEPSWGHEPVTPQRYDQWPPPRRRHTATRVMAAAVLVAVGTFLGVGISHDFWRSHDTAASQTLRSGSTGTSGTYNFTPAAGSGSGSASASDTSLHAAAAKVSPALVDINVTEGYQGGRGAATGIVLTPTGLVLTNNHVINGATQISATDIGNGHTYTATVVGYDRSHDIAVIQLNGASGLKTAQFADSNGASVGQSVVAIGNAGGTGGTPSVATGSLVALDQQITASDASGGTSEQLSGLMQTNADIQPGDSGGSLVNSNGQVIGVDTAASSGFTFDSSSQAQTQGFAVPSDTALSVATQIANRHASSTVHIGSTGFLGVEVQAAGSQDFGSQFTTPSQGASVAGVLPGSPASGAGLVSGDVITSVNGTSVTTPNSLSLLLGHYQPGDTVHVTWTDQSGSQHSAAVKLATGPAG
jgi:S1-C subfamily serine protease